MVERDVFVLKVFEVDRGNLIFEAVSRALGILAVESGELDFAGNFRLEAFYTNDLQREREFRLEARGRVAVVVLTFASGKAAAKSPIR